MGPVYRDCCNFLVFFVLCYHAVVYFPVILSSYIDIVGLGFLFKWFGGAVVRITGALEMPRTLSSIVNHPPVGGCGVISFIHSLITLKARLFILFSILTLHCTTTLFSFHHIFIARPFLDSVYFIRIQPTPDNAQPPINK